MAGSDKVDLARRLFVEEGRTLPQLALDLEVALFVLQKASTEEDWATQREQFKAKVQAIDPYDTLAQHKEMVREHMLRIRFLRAKMDREMDRGERLALKDEIEMLLMLSQSLDLVVSTDRKVSGIKNSAPSVAPGANEEQGVQYIVSKPEAQQQVKQA